MLLFEFYFFNLVFNLECKADINKVDITVILNPFIPYACCFPFKRYNTKKIHICQKYISVLIFLNFNGISVFMFMFEFFNAIGGFITTIVNFIVNIFEVLSMVVGSMIRAVAWLFACLAYLPPFLVGFVVVPISIAIIFQLINKGS